MTAPGAGSSDQPAVVDPRREPGVEDQVQSAVGVRLHRAAERDPVRHLEPVAGRVEPDPEVVVDGVGGRGGAGEQEQGDEQAEWVGAWVLPGVL